MRFLSLMEGHRWVPGVGDPDPIDWLITAAYFATAGFCLRAWWRERSAARDSRAAGDETARLQLVPRFWFFLALGIFFLGMNKQLDLQSLLTEVGRRWAEAGGWYENRRRAQKIFILGLAGGGAAALAGVSWWLRRAWRHYLLALAGLAVLGAFILIRASLFHHYAILRSETEDHLPHDAVLELLGDALLCAAAWRAIGRASRPRPAPRPGKPRAFERFVRIE